MSLLLAAFGGLVFSRMGRVNENHTAGGGGGGSSTPTYYILGF